MRKKIFKSVIHGIVLILLHLFYFNLNWSVPLEYELMIGMSKAEAYLGGSGKFKPGNCLLVNTAYDLTLMQSETDYGDSIDVVLSDRELLARFFETLAAQGNRHKYIICDILFEEKTPYDSALSASIRKTPRVIAPGEYNEETRQLEKPVVTINHAQADYITYEGIVTKMRLYARESGSKTLPMSMYEDYYKRKTRVTGVGLIDKRGYVPFAIYPRYFFSHESTSQHEIRLKTVLDLLQPGDTLAYNNMIRDKIIIVGNFKEDMHFTPLGPMPGSLILLNTYLTLESGYHILKWAWFVFAFFCFSLLCYYELYVKRHSAEKKEKSLKSLFGHFLGLSGWCILISLLSGLIFKVHITIIPLILYIEAARYLQHVNLSFLKKKK